MTSPTGIQQKLRKTTSALNSGTPAPLAPHGAACRQSNQLPPVAGFTLIELLVVISIIMILAGLLMPALNSALNSAYKTTAKNQATQIATAITAYETEYGRLPTNSGTTVATALVNILCTTNDAVNNPRGILFLDSAVWKKGKGGTNSSGFCNPFTNTGVYSVALDTGYSNSITVPTNATGTQTGIITKHIGVWTIWTNKSQTTLIDSWD